MKKGKFFILFILLIVVLLIAFVLEDPLGILSKGKDKGPAPLFPDFQVDLISKIEVEGPAKKVGLERRDGRWWLVDPVRELQDRNLSGEIAVSNGVDGDILYPADENLVKRMTDKFSEFKIEGVVSKNPKKHPVFQVDDSGVEIKVFDAEENKLAHLFIGKLGPDFSSTYIRADGMDEVILFNESVKSTFEKHPRMWKDRVIFKFDKENVVSFTLTNLHTDFSQVNNLRTDFSQVTLNKNEEGIWHVTSPEEFEADSKKIGQNLNNLSSLNAYDIADMDDKDEYGLSNPIFTIEATFIDGSVEKLVVGAEKGGRFYARKEGGDEVYLINKATLNNLRKKLEDLKGEGD